MTKDSIPPQPERDETNRTGRPRRVDSAPRAVATRRRALEQMQAAVLDWWSRPLLLTGEPGAGKTWLAGQLAARLPAGWRAHIVELTSALDSLEFLRLVADGLGLPMTERLGVARLRIRAALEDDAREGRRWLLVGDEVHRASPVVWEEIETIAGTLGRPDGFAGLLLLARTEFLREAGFRRPEGWAIRSARHVHLMPLDLDEARELIGREGRFNFNAGAESERELEEWHRDALGNPRLLLQLAELRALGQGLGQRPAPGQENRGRRRGSPNAWNPPTGSRTQERPETAAPSLPREEDTAPAGDTPPSRSPSLIPARPPIRLEEGLVEVGWDGDLEPESTRVEDVPDEPEAAASPDSDRDEQLVDDRYAAMQAWTEWSRNRERPIPAAGAEIPEDPPVSSSPPVSPAGSEAAPREEQPGGPDPATPGKIRPGAPHEFAPYSQLFSRIRQSKQG